MQMLVLFGRILIFWSCLKTFSTNRSLQKVFPDNDPPNGVEQLDVVGHRHGARGNGILLCHIALSHNGVLPSLSLPSFSCNSTPLSLIQSYSSPRPLKFVVWWSFSSNLFYGISSQRWGPLPSKTTSYHINHQTNMNFINSTSNSDPTIQHIIQSNPPLPPYKIEGGEGDYLGELISRRKINKLYSVQLDLNQIEATKRER